MTVLAVTSTPELVIHATLCGLSGGQRRSAGVIGGNPL